MELFKNVANSAPTINFDPSVGIVGKEEVNSNKHLGLGASVPAFLYLKEIDIEVAFKGTITSL